MLPFVVDLCYIKINKEKFPTAFIIQHNSDNFKFWKILFVSEEKIMEKNVHTITVAGEKLTLTSTNRSDYVEKLAEDLSARIENLTHSSISVSKLSAAIVCALDLLDENYRLKLLIEDMKNGEGE